MCRFHFKPGINSGRWVSVAPPLVYPTALETLLYPPKSDAANTRLFENGGALFVCRVVGCSIGQRFASPWSSGTLVFVCWSVGLGLVSFLLFSPCFWVDHAVHAVLSWTVHLIAIVLFHAPTPSRQGFLTWVPHACKLRYLDTKDIEKCMSGVTGTPRTITYVGDSRARTQVRYLSITRAHMPKY